MEKIRVFAPSSVANVSCGYDIFGFAIDEPGDEVVVKIKNKPGVVITKITGDNGKLPKEADKNTAGVAVQSFLKNIKTNKGVEIELYKKMPLCSGLGSSATSAVAAVFGANMLFGNILSKEELLLFTMESEKIACGSAHADNVAPSLFGGFVLIRSYNPLDIVKIPTPDLYCTIIHPDIIVKTKDARKILKPEVCLKDVVAQCGNVAALIAGFYKLDYELISRSLNDCIIEPQRSKFIPGFMEVKKAALNNGALGSSISGSGPSIFALCKTLAIAKIVGNAMQKAFELQNIDSDIYISKINNVGPREVIDNEEN
ncbi:MAG: homoserine kinase [Candidatus Aenigmarchaeota archaeon ex4484_52]|nr:MAG: homoserine kinase [Candidatus Aenigmarchaeota archaeon ex4484_52]